jgi:hypothetical protein
MALVDATSPCQSWRPWSVHSRAEISFLLGEQRAAERVTQRLFRRMLQRHEYAGLAGAPDEGRVEIGVFGGALYLELSHPRLLTYRAYYYVYRKRNDLVLSNEGFHILDPSLQCHGLGLLMFHRQTGNATRLGIARIATVAGRRFDENGYYTWPRFGFDGSLPASVKRRLPSDLNQSQSVLDLMDNEHGRCWWREYGSTLSVAFDLARTSRSQMVFHQYVYARKRATGLKTNLENA